MVLFRFLALLLVASSAGAAPVKYALDPERTRLTASTRPGGIGGFTHKHVIVAKKVRGEVTYDAEAPSASKVVVTVPASALVPDEDAVRKRAGLEPLSANDQARIAETMRGPGQLEVEQHPALHFESTAVKSLGPGKLQVTGRLSLHGVTREVTLPVTLTVRDGVLESEGRLTIRHSDFGITPYSAVLGALKNLDPIDLELKLVGRKLKAES